MSDAADIRNRIHEEVFDYQTLLGCLGEYRKPRDRISSLLASGHIVRVKKGLYIFGEAFRRRPYAKETVANLMYGPSYISLESALAYHGMIPERVETITSVTTGKRRTFVTPLGTFTYTPLSVARYRVGMDRVEQSGGVAFLIATPEKALLDKAWADRRFHGESLSDCRAYLLEDLRVSPESLRALDAGRLRAIETSYASAKISRVVKAVLKEAQRE